MGNGLRQAAARAQPRDECRSAADRDLIFGPVVEKVLADARGGFGASVAIGVVDVDEAAPVFGEFLVTDDSTEPPDGGLVDGTQLGSGCRLRVGGDQIKAGLDGVVLSEGFDETKDGERAQLMVLVDGGRLSEISSGQQLTMPSRSPSLAEGCEQLAHLLGASGVHHVTPVDLGEPTDGLVVRP